MTTLVPESVAKEVGASDLVRPYAKPSVTVYGSVVEITDLGSSNGKLEGLFFGSCSSCCMGPGCCISN